MERSRNRRTGDREERQDFINLDESESHDDYYGAILTVKEN